MSTSNALKALFLTLLLSLPTVAQTSSELKQKYGAPLTEIFLVQPKIAASVTYAENGEVCRVKIEPYRSSATSKSSDEEMPSEVVNTIIEEFAPVSQRGSLVNSFSAEFGRNGHHMDCYEHVSIERVTRGKNYAWVIIKWKRASCKAEDDFCQIMSEANAPPNNSFNASANKVAFMR